MIVDAHIRGSRAMHSGRTLRTGATRVDVPIGSAYKESVARARDVALAADRTVEGTVVTPAPDVVVTELGASSVNMNVRVWIDDAAGIEIPYPHLQLFLENVDNRVWQRAATLATVSQWPET